MKIICFTCVTFVSFCTFAQEVFANAVQEVLLSTRVAAMRSPSFPKSYKDCQALRESFAEVISKFSEMHGQCLVGSPSEQEQNGGTCSKAACQGLHTSISNASSQAAEEGRICSARVEAYVQKQREEEAEARERIAETERRKALREQEDRDDAVRNKVERDVRKLQRDAARAEQAKHEVRQSAEREARERVTIKERDRWARDLEASRRGQDRQALEISWRESLEHRIEAAREARASQADYERELSELRQKSQYGNPFSMLFAVASNPFLTGLSGNAAKGNVSLGSDDWISEAKDEVKAKLLEKGFESLFALENPFQTDVYNVLTPKENAAKQLHRWQESVLAYQIKAGNGILGPPDQASSLAKEQVRKFSLCIEDCERTRSRSDGLVATGKGIFRDEVLTLGSNALVDKALDMTIPIGPEAKHNGHDTVATVFDAYRGAALNGNPFAQAVSGMAMEGVKKVHGQTIGQMDEIGKQVDGVIHSAINRSSSSNPFRPTPVAAGGAQRVQVSAAAVAELQVSEVRPVNNSADGSVAEVPPGYVLYRPSASEQVSVLRHEDVQPGTTGDRPELGRAGCSTTGIGIVTSECERARQRTSNPFLKR